MTVVVLDEPQELVNIAQVIRGMKNFGVRDLRLVRPREFDAVRIEGIAHQSSDIIRRVRCVETLEAALADCVHIVGFTARGRTAKRTWQRPREAAAEVLALSESGPVALLFGREERACRMRPSIAVREWCRFPPRPPTRRSTWPTPSSSCCMS